MSNILPAVTVGVGTTSRILLPHVNAIQAMKLSNGSPFDLNISGFGGETVVPTGTEYMLYAEVQNTGYINIYSVNNLSMPPLSTGIVNMVVYYEGEKLPPGVWPISIPAQVVTASVDIAQQVVSDGYAPGTHVVEAQESGSPGSNVLIDNQGNFNISEVTAGVIRDFIHCYHGGDGLGHSVVFGDVVSGIVYVKNTLEVTGGIVVSTGIQHISSGGGSTAMERATQADGSLDIGAGPSAGSIRVGPSGNIKSLGTNMLGLGTQGTDRNVLDHTGNITYWKSPQTFILQMPSGTTRATFTDSYGSTIGGTAGTAAFCGDVRCGTENSGRNANLYLCDNSKFSGIHQQTYTSGVSTSHGCNKQPQGLSAVPAVGAVTTVACTALTATNATFATGSGIQIMAQATTYN